MTLASALSLEEYIVALRERVEARLYEIIGGRADRDVLMEVVREGKRLRPILLMMVFHALGGRNEEKALEVACALELAHNASLTHDDVIDGDMTRRGRPSLWRRLGIGRAVIEGHRIINMAFQITLKEGIEVSKIFLKAWDRASSGVLNEIMFREPTSKKLYLSIIREKTASLFEAAAESGALIAEAPPRVVELARRYGEQVGIAYQLADDYVDIVKKSSILRLPILFMERLEEKLKLAYISLRFARRLNLKELLAPRMDWKRFLVEEIRNSVRNARSIVDEMGLEEPHRTYLKKFPAYCVNSMLAEARRKA